MGVTIKDVAKRTGLSVTTVSLVLNKKESRIPERTKQLIESAAQELNYTPNQTAVSLVTKRTQTLGLVLPEVAYYNFADLVRSMEIACKNAGYFLMLSLVGLDDEEALEQIESLLRRGVDGLVFDPSFMPDSVRGYRECLEASVAPIVPLGCINTLLLPNSIAPEHRQGGFVAAAHLLQLGHRQIGYICGPATLGVASTFISGCRDASEEYGAQWNEENVYEGSYCAATGAAGLAALRRRGVTGIVCGADSIAAGVYRAAHTLGLSIPGNLSVVGYGNTALAADFFVPLTTVSIHFDRIARKAVNIIRKNEQDRKLLTPEMILPTLMQRESSAAPGGTILGNNVR